jgi:type I restriction enzyme S subunit
MNGRLQAYPEYKDSGLTWLGRIPALWEEKRAKFYFREVDERSTTGTEQLMSVSHKTGVTPRKANVTMFMAESNLGHKICYPGDLVINTMWAWMAAMGVSRQTGLVSPSYGVYRLRKSSRFVPDYVDHLIRTQPYISEYICRSTGIRPSRLRLYPDDFLNIPIICPPHEEQEAIVRFISHYDRLVRRFIHNRRRLIGVLNEQKQAIINRAVTRGLDPNVPLKPSGIDWLGGIPEHWKIKRLKWVTRLQRGYDLPQQDRVAGQYPVVSSGGIIDTHNESRAVGPGVVMGRCGSTDAVFFIKEDFWPHNTSLFVTNFQDNNKRWCYYLLRTISKADHAAKSAVPAVDRKDLFDIYVPVPPYHEQSANASRLDAYLESTDEAIRRTKIEIDLIREYRTRLIADVVTGKADVRHLAPPPEVMAAEASPHDPDEGLDDEMLGEEDDLELVEEATDADD